MATEGAPLTVTVDQAGTIAELSLFLGLSNLGSMEADALLMWLESPSAMTRELMDCDRPTELGGRVDVYWGEVTTDFSPALADYAGQSAEGSWTLELGGCAGDPLARLESWGLCITFQ